MEHGARRNHRVRFTRGNAKKDVLFEPLSAEQMAAALSDDPPF